MIPTYCQGHCENRLCKLLNDIRADTNQLVAGPEQSPGPTPKIRSPPPPRPAPLSTRLQSLANSDQGRRVEWVR